MDDRRRARVEVGLDLVEQQHPRIADERARERDARLLAGRQAAPPFGDPGRQAVGQLREDIVEVREAAHPLQFGGPRR